MIEVALSNPLKLSNIVKAKEFNAVDYYVQQVTKSQFRKRTLWIYIITNYLIVYLPQLKVHGPHHSPEQK